MTSSPPDPTLVPRNLAGARLDEALVALVPGRSKAWLQKLVRRGGVRLDGRKVWRSNVRLRGGERLEVRLADRAEPEARLPELLHEEEGFLVFDKPAGMLVHPTERLAGGTLSELAVARYGPLPSVPGENRPGIVHRLDRETSGVIVVARTPEALEALRSQFRHRTTSKRYLAVVHGRPTEDAFEVTLPLGPRPDRKDHQHVDLNGRKARSRFEVLERFDNHALLSCVPTTGRRHQLRVHLESRGHPIVADKLYRAVGAPPLPTRVCHHALHAAELSFDRPGTGERLTFRAPLRAELEALLTSLRTGNPR